LFDDDDIGASCCVQSAPEPICFGRNSPVPRFSNERKFVPCINEAFMMPRLTGENLQLAISLAERTIQ
jgi:hypothetical protein